ncbi:hypothetical protein CK623_05120 [Vandammella animalimorsus]|uniref:Cobalamin biosynthesis protein CobD n=1 Tax=Vandammella animalimorsus TaxID=2029117 RepID=A0A2A2ASN1_9BURK|nr:hypothetical protein [Vandammella animalimorsus]PAT40738.1 hypothetical protein CK623_05120 [Vandammella animalimorsus]
MSVLALFVALLLEQLRPLHARQRWHGALQALRWRLQYALDAGTPGQAWVLWALAVCLPAVIVWLIFALLQAGLGRFAAFLWSVFVLYAVLRFRAFGPYFTQVRNAINTGDRQAAAQALERWRQALEGGWAQGHAQGDGLREHAQPDTVPAQDDGPAALLAASVTYSVQHMHHYVFGVFAAYLLLAFLGLGPMGAVLFCLAQAAHGLWWRAAGRHDDPHGASMALARVARQGWQWVNWLPARITAGMFAAVGRYDEAISAWRACTARRPGDGDALVLAAGSAALGLPGRSVQWILAWPHWQGRTPSRILDGADQGSDELVAGLLHRLASLMWRTLVLWVLLWLVIGLIGAVL